MDCIFCRSGEEISSLRSTVRTRNFALGFTKYRSGELGSIRGLGMGIRIGSGYALCLFGKSWECVGLRARVDVVRGIRDLRNACGPTRSLDLRHVARYP